MILKINTNKYLENEIIKMLINGESAQTIAKNLNYARSSIYFKLRKIFKKYNVSSQKELVSKVFKNELAKLRTENENLRIARKVIS